MDPTSSAGIVSVDYRADARLPWNMADPNPHRMAPVGKAKSARFASNSERPFLVATVRVSAIAPAATIARLDTVFQNSAIVDVSR
jgi:hypothetical protein